VFFVVGEIANVTVATTPFEMAVELIPHTMHIDVPALVVQESCLPAAVATVLAAMVAEVISAVAYFRVHCSPVGAVAVPLRVILKATVVPGVAEPEETLSAVDPWSAQEATGKIMNKAAAVLRTAARSLLIV
jgi:hypothetical protein